MSENASPPVPIIHFGMARLPGSRLNGLLTFPPTKYIDSLRGS